MRKKAKLTKDSVVLCPVCMGKGEVPIKCVDEWIQRQIEGSKKKEEP